MSPTQSIIAEGDLWDWKGVCHQINSYPLELGVFLVDAYYGHFNQDLDAMLKFLLEDHGGWENIVGTDLSLEAGYRPGTNCPQCLCHGEKYQGEDYIHRVSGGYNKDISRFYGDEYAYVFDRKKKILHILATFSSDGGKFINFYDRGNENVHWEEIGRIKLLKRRKPIEWEAIDHYSIFYSDWKNYEKK